MKNYFTTIDAALINMLEKGTHWFQGKFSKTNFWLAKWIATAGAFEVFCAAMQMAREVELSILRWIGLLITIPVMFLYANYFWKREEEKAFIRVSKGESNPRKIDSRDRWRRTMVLVTMSFCFLLYTLAFMSLAIKSGSLLVLLLILFAAIMFVQLPLFYYLIACDPLPPSNEKAAEKTKTTPLVSEVAS